MKTLDRYVATTVAVHFASALAVLVAVFSVINLAQELEDIGGGYGVRQALWFVLLTLPNEAYQLFPAAALLGGVLGLGALAAHNELTAMAACGVSRLRLTGAVMYAAVGLMIAAGLLGEFVAAPLAAVAQAQRAGMLSEGRTLSTATGLWTRDGSRFVNVRAAHPDGSLGDLYFYDIDPDHRMQRFTYARSASYAHHQWTLEDLAETTFAEGTAARRQVASQPWDPALSPRQLQVLFIPADELSVSDLWRAIGSLRARDESAQRHELALWRRLTMPPVTVIMLLLAFPFVPFNTRAAPLGQRIVLGALAGIGFQMFSQVFGSFGLLYGLPPVLGALLPPALAAGVGLWWLQRAD